MAEDKKGIYKYPGKDFAEEDISKPQNNDTATITRLRKLNQFLNYGSR